METKVKSAIFSSYNKAVACGKFERLRINRALGIIQHGEQRPYATSITDCTCPDFAKHHKPCKHIIAKMVLYRAFEAILKDADSVIITEIVIVDGEQFPIDTITAHKLAEKANFKSRLIYGGLAYRKG